METINYSFKKDVLFNRCSVDIAQCGEHTDGQPEMCEHDRAWFEVALIEAANVVVQELARIAKTVQEPLSNIGAWIDFQAVPVRALQKILLHEAIERYLISHIVNLWYTQRLNTSVADCAEALSQLKHITLMNNGVSRKPHY